MPITCMVGTMHILDDIDSIRKTDRHSMLRAISSRPTQIRDSFKIINSIDIPKSSVKNIVAVGMGGSSLPSDMLKAWLLENTGSCMDVWRDYGFPFIGGRDTLVIAVSYSGNTEETIDAMQSAAAKGCAIIGISSGGKLEEICRNSGYCHLKIPTGLPPRAASGYLFSLQSLVLEKLGLCSISEELRETADLLDGMLPNLNQSRPLSDNIAKKIAVSLVNRTPVIYGSGILAPVARCWQAYFNENSKVLAWSGIIPEMNHNEIVGWVECGCAENYLPIILNSDNEPASVKKKKSVLRELIFARMEKIIDVDSKGASGSARLLSTSWTGEFASVYLAILRGIDPTPVNAIESFKKKIRQ